MKASKPKIYSRLQAFMFFLLGAALVSAAWMANFYNQISSPQTRTEIRDTATAPNAVPSLAEMALKRSEFTHEQVHPHPNEKGMERLREILTENGIEPDDGTIELIETMAEQTDKTSLMVAKDITRIANGDYHVAEEYNVFLERRLIGDEVAGTKDKPLAVKNIRYQIHQTWIDKPVQPWDIGKRLLRMGKELPNERILPDDSKMVAQSFLDVMPDVMETTSWGARFTAVSDPLELHRIR